MDAKNDEKKILIDNYEISQVLEVFKKSELSMSQMQEVLEKSKAALMEMPIKDFT